MLQVDVFAVLFINELKALTNVVIGKLDKLVHNLIATSSRGNLYGQFKLENYLLKLSPNERALITKLKWCNLKIPVETGRWVNIPREEKICHLCHNDIGSEDHYIFGCSFSNVIDISKNIYLVIILDIQISKK
jgi:hypothetical protein